MAKDENKKKKDEEGTNPPESEAKTKKPKGAVMPESEAKRFQAEKIGTVIDIKRNRLAEERIFTYEESLAQLEKMLKEATQ